MKVPEPYLSMEMDKYSPFIFISGVKESGVSPMGAFINAHPYVHCRIAAGAIKQMLEIREKIVRNKVIMIGTGVPAPYLCIREEDVMTSAKFLSVVFPNARFVFMIRDGRSVVDNLMENKVYRRIHNISDFSDGLEDWDSRIEIMDKQCAAVGDRCLRVYYETLALHPERELRRVMKFLGLPWIDGVLRPNQEHMDEEDTIWWMRKRPRNQSTMWFVLINLNPVAVFMNVPGIFPASHGKRPRREMLSL
ncbi:unnamed protein product [Heligmosomoides polygyrus]|uniref:Protein-tyrosine sulfotransferase n=1 Tax=Heligmosomoides polygyrus TaxID=6339 RepID=A0A3P8EPG4_HELPZ|nr:unnamed protein product [Heligmosomoides polygyrus]